MERQISDILDQALNTISTTGNDVAHIRTKLDNHENEKVLKWLTLIEYDLQQNDHLARRQPGTGQWLIRSQEFLKWLCVDKQTLFCLGIPGAGKTILTSIVVNDLHTRFSDDETVGIAYIYCNFQRKTDQTVNSLLASLLKQLCQRRSSLPQSVQDLYDEHKSTQTRPLLKETSTALQSVLGLYSRVFIVVDALDEVSDSCRDRILPELFILQRNCAINIFATSRHIPDVINHFHNSISIEIRASKTDVMTYLECHMEQLPAFVQGNQQLQENIKTEISEAVDGMFLLAQIYLGFLEDKLTINAIRSALSGFRTQGRRSYKNKDQILTAAYNQTMDRISRKKEGFRELAMKVISWITCAKRPLTQSELQHALAINVKASKLDQGDLLRLEDMISACARLVTIDKESNIIRLVHYTTQEYFEQTMSRWFPNANRGIAEACITYLSFEDPDTGDYPVDTVSGDQPVSDKLYNYAAQNWGHHARIAADDLKDRALSFLRSGDKFSAANYATMVHGSPLSHNQGTPQQITGLHVAAYFGLAEAVRALLISGDYPDHKDFYEQTPLLLAAANGYVRVVSILLASHHVDINSKNKYGRTPLFCAIQGGHKEIINQLLKRDDIDLNSKDIYGQTPLIWAKANGNIDIVNLLIAREHDHSTTENPSQGSDLLSRAARHGDTLAVGEFLKELHPDVLDENGLTPMWWAVKEGHEAIVELLLKFDARTDFKDVLGRTLLWHAAHRGHKIIVELLLKTEAARAHHSDDNGHTLLLCAAEGGHIDVLRLLLEEGMKLEFNNIDDKVLLQYAKDLIQLLLTADRVKVALRIKEGQTLLIQAAERGHMDVVKFLFNIGVSGDNACGNNVTLYWYAAGVIQLSLNANTVNTQLKDERDRTLLSYAAENGHNTVVQLLLDKGADIESTPVMGFTPLSYAARSGHEVVVQLLLNRGAKFMSMIYMRKTPLYFAIMNGHETIVRLLLDKGADIEENSGIHTPLMVAAENGHEAIVRLLLDKGADIEENSSLRTPLMVAVENGHKAVVQLLLDRGADIEAKDYWGTTPLLYAARNRQEAVIWQLLDNGSEVEIKDLLDRTPLWYSAGNGYEDIVRQLLDSGARIESEDYAARTPLFIAITKGHEAVVRLLLDRGAQTDMVDWNGKSPLSLTAERGHETLVRLLLDNGAPANSKHKDCDIALSRAAENGYEAIVRLLLERGAKLEAKGRHDETALFLAAENGHEAVVRFFLDRGANLESKDVAGEIPLSAAAKNGHEAIVQLLVKSGTNPESKDAFGHTPLLHSSRWGKEAIVRLLLDKGARLEAKSFLGHTPLQVAAVNGHEPVVQLLLDKGAELESRDNRGRTPLLAAAESGQEAIVRLLLGKGAELKSRDNNGQTPLLAAAEWGQEAVVRLLLDKGAEFESRDSGGRTPLLAAAELGQEAIVQLLLDKGAELESRDSEGQTPLLAAALGGYTTIVRLLLDKGAMPNSEFETGQT